MRVSILCWVLLCFGYCFQLVAQTSNVDSLQRLLDTNLPDSSRLEILNNLVYSQHYQDAATSVEYSLEALEIADRLQSSEAFFWTYYFRTMACMASGQFPQAAESGRQALTYATEQQNTERKIVVHLQLASAYDGLGDFQSAMQQLEIGRELAIMVKDTERIINTYSKAAQFHLESDQPEEAYHILQEAVALQKIQKDTLGLAMSYVSMAKSGQAPDERLELLQKGYRLARLGGHGFHIINAGTALADYYYFDSIQLDSAIFYYDKVFEMASRFREPYTLLQTHLRIGEILSTSGLLDSAEYHFRKGLTITSPGIFDTDRLALIRALAALQQQRGQYKEAYQTMVEAQTQAEIIYAQERQTALTNADARFQLSQKEAEIVANQLEIAERKGAQSRQLLWGIALLAAFLGGFQYIFYRRRQHQREVELALKNERAEADRLRELDELKSRFFTNVSHELRTPLTLISSPLEEALKELKQVQLAPKLNLAHRNTQRLLGLTNEILDLAKLEAGRLELSNHIFFVLPQVSRILSAFESQAEIHNQQLSLIANIDAAQQLSTDIQKLETILNNLLSNALKFTPTGGAIKLQIGISSTANLIDSDQFIILVKDSGQGIHPDDLARVFDRFYQSQHNQSAQGGSGIGLALSHRLAKLLGGKLTVESTRGEGSTFQLSLPIQRTQEKPDASEYSIISTTSEILQTPEEKHIKELEVPGKGKASKTLLSRPRLLIVEDNLDMSSYLLDSLKGSYECQIAANGQEALELLATNDFDLITSDVMMPMMDGFTLRAAINERTEWQRIPFILLTARTLEEDKLKGFQLGIDDYITKPFSLPELRARINSLLRNKRSREQEWADEQLSSQEEQLVQKATAVVQERIDDTSFNVEELADALHYSQRQLARVLGPLTGLSPVQFILEIRLQAARRMLERRLYPTVTEVRYAIGIESASYFSRKFKERFGRSPGEV